MSSSRSQRFASTSLISATLASLCQLGQTAAAANSAPVLDPTFAFTAVSENDFSSNNGDILFPLLHTYTDADLQTDQFQGIAITRVDDSNGTWQYTPSLFGGAPVWIDIPTDVSDTHALLLSFNSSRYSALRFVPKVNFKTPNSPLAGITLRGWDGSDGLSSSTDAMLAFTSTAGVNGGATAYSAVAAVGSISVTPGTDFPTPFNTAPVLDPIGRSLLGVFPASGTNSPGVAIDVLLSAGSNGGAAPESDVDLSVTQGPGIAIIAADGANGTWQYTTDGQNFQAFPGNLSTAAALVLAAGAEAYSHATGTAVRFVPVNGFHGTATFTYRAWDQSDDANGLHRSGTSDNTTSNGGTSPFSAATRTASISGQNSAPVLAAGSGSLGTITNAVDGQVASFAVSDLLAAAQNGGSAPLSDADGDPLGIAVSAVDSSHGTWEISSGEGSFSRFPAVVAGSALVLGAGDVLRFVPNGDFAGSAALTYRGWDGTDGSSVGDLVVPGAGGGATAFSAASRTAAFTVTSSPFTEITDTSTSGLQATVAALLGPSPQIAVVANSINYTGGTEIGASQGSSMVAIDLGTAADGTRMTIAGSGLLLTSGDGTPRLANTDAADLDNGQTASVDLGGVGDLDLEALVGTDTHDACVLSFSFTVPAGIHSVSFQMMFGSEEFTAFLDDVTDGAAVFVDGHDAGHNAAVFDGDPTKFLHISSAISSLIESNTTASPLASEYNGITRPATVTAVLDPQLTVHTIKIVVADTSDGIFDSGLFISRLVGGTATTGGGIVVVPPGPPGSANVAHVTLPPIGVSQGATVTYASLCPSTPEGVADLSAHLAGLPSTKARAFAFDTTAQAYVELPAAPSGGLTPSTGVFLATRLDLGLDFSGTPAPLPFDIVLHPGFNFVGVPPLGTLSSFTTTHRFPDDFTVSSGGVAVTDPADIASLLGTPGSDIATAEPFFWSGSGYVQEAVLTTGKGYWIKNNASVDVTLSRVQSPSLGGGSVLTATATVRRASAAVADVHDRGVPPPPPGGRSADAGSTAADGGSGGAKSCGLGSGVAAFASMLLLALRRRLREWR